MLLCYAMFCKEQFLNSVFWLSPVSPIDIITRWPWLITLRDTIWISLLYIGIHGMDPTTGLPMTMTKTMTTALIASLSSPGPDFGPKHFIHLGYSITT